VCIADSSLLYNLYRTLKGFINDLIFRYISSLAKKLPKGCSILFYIVTRVMPSLFFSVVSWSVGGAVGQAYSFASFGLCVGLGGLQMCMIAKSRH
jgi:hypothetical protein